MTEKVIVDVAEYQRLLNNEEELAKIKSRLRELEKESPKSEIEKTENSENEDKIELEGRGEDYEINGPKIAATVIPEPTPPSSYPPPSGPKPLLEGQLEAFIPAKKLKKAKILLKKIHASDSLKLTNNFKVYVDGQELLGANAGDLLRAVVAPLARHKDPSNLAGLGQFLTELKNLNLLDERVTTPQSKASTPAINEDNWYFLGV